MKRIDIRILIGVFLIGAGVLFFLQTLNILPNAWGILGSSAILFGSVIFFYIYFSNRVQWWALIPAMTLLGLSGTIFVNSYFSQLPNLGGAIFLGSIALGFWIIYLSNREFWWAIIPGGVLFTLAIVIISEDLIVGDSEGGVFFIGLAITFVLVALLAKPRENFWWAYIPAGVLLVLGIFLTGPLHSFFNLVWPIALILIGGLLLFRNIRNR